MRSRLLLLGAGLVLAAGAACLNPQPLPPDEGDPRANATSSSGGSSSGGFGGSVNDEDGKESSSGQTTNPPAPIEAGVADSDASTNASTDAGDAGDASDDGG